VAEGTFSGLKNRILQPIARKVPGGMTGRLVTGTEPSSPPCCKCFRASHLVPASPVPMPVPLIRSSSGPLPTQHTLA
jgi:hypothetical protein